MKGSRVEYDMLLLFHQEPGGRHDVGWMVQSMQQGKRIHDAGPNFITTPKGRPQWSKLIHGRLVCHSKKGGGWFGVRLMVGQSQQQGTHNFCRQFDLLWFLSHVTIMGMDILHILWNAMTQNPITTGTEQDLSMLHRKGKGS